MLGVNPYCFAPDDLSFLRRLRTTVQSHAIRFG